MINVMGWGGLESYTYCGIDVPVVEVAMHSVVLVVEVVELAIGTNEEAVPVVGDGGTTGEVECQMVAVGV